MHYAENECAMPIGLHCNELRALCLTRGVLHPNALCRTAEIGALLLKYVLIVCIWPEKRCVRVLGAAQCAEPSGSTYFCPRLYIQSAGIRNTQTSALTSASLHGVADCL